MVLAYLQRWLGVSLGVIKVFQIGQEVHLISVLSVCQVKRVLLVGCSFAVDTSNTQQFAVITKLLEKKGGYTKRIQVVVQVKVCNILDGVQGLAHNKTLAPTIRNLSRATDSPLEATRWGLGRALGVATGRTSSHQIEIARVYQIRPHPIGIFGFGIAMQGYVRTHKPPP